MTNYRRDLRRTAWALMACVCLFSSAPARAQDDPPHHRKFDAAVRAAVRDGRSVRAIVRFKDDGSRQRGALIVATGGGHIRRALNDVGGLNVEVDPTTADTLASDTGVLSVSIDAQVRASATTPRHAVRSSGAKNARERFNRSGSNISVAVIDSGVQPHADLPASRIRRFVDFVNGRTDPYDDFGHGSHVAGILAGSGAASAGFDQSYEGVAPEVDVVALKVLDENGAGNTSDVIAALEWVAANHLRYNIRVVNMSLGHPVYEPSETDPLVYAAEALVRRGIVVVASAGNLGIHPRSGEVGYGGVTSPANGAAIIAVGAVDDQGSELRSDDRVTNYSSRGPTRFDMILKPDIVASGHHVVSISAPGSYLFENYPALQIGVGSENVASYMMLSGTSMAAPVVSGAAALMIQSNPRLTAGTVRAVLEFTAQVLPDTDVMTQGAGYLNAFGAVRLAGLLKPRVDVGQIWLRSPYGVPHASDELFGEQIVWGKRVIWGDGVLLGDSAYVHLAAWDERNIPWGQSCDPNDATCNIVWGQCDGDDCGARNIVWGQSGLQNIVWGQCADADCKNIVWGQDARNIVWGQTCAPNDSACNIVWGQTCNPNDPTCNIVWGQTCDPNDPSCNIVWGQTCDPNDPSCNIVWGQTCDPNDPTCNIVWGQSLDILTDGGR